MNQESDLTERFKAFAKQGLKFEQAKETLIKSGYSEEQVMQASEQFSYDAVEAGNDATSNLTPKLKQDYGDALLAAQTDRDSETFTGDALGAATGVIGPSSTYEKRDYFITYDLGIPWWLYYGGSIVIAIFAVIYRLPAMFVQVGVGVFILCTVLRKVPRYRKPNRNENS